MRDQFRAMVQIAKIVERRGVNGEEETGEQLQERNTERISNVTNANKKQKDRTE